MSFDAGTLMVALEQGNPIPDILPAMSRQTRQGPTTTNLHRERQLEGIRQGEGRRGWVSPRIGVGEPATPSTPRPGASFNWRAFPERLPQSGSQGRHGRRQGFVEISRPRAAHELPRNCFRNASLLADRSNSSKSLD